MGVSLAVKAQLGITAVSALPYALSLMTGLSLGTWTVIAAFVYVLLQWIILREKFELRYILQIPFTFILGAFIDLTGLMLNFSTPELYIHKVLLFLGSPVLIVIGLFFILVPHIVDSTAEGLVRAITIRYNVEFGRWKLYHDIFTSMTALTLGLLFIENAAIVREGTVIATVIIGPLLGWMFKVFKPKLDRLIQ